MRVYAIAIQDLMKAHDFFLSQKFGLSIGGRVKATKIKLVFISALGDMEKQNELCCKFSGKNMVNRRCNISHELLNDPFQKCYRVSKTSIVRHVKQLQSSANDGTTISQCCTNAQKSSLQKLNDASTYPVINAFWDAPWIDG